ncbi:helix-turn-helix transcriptional regulator [Nocardia cyriacigeorgica]|uniref:helix-turn-helix transcriptional regulator n=1 Tax=Nocardia cyriacigeorgica TaxID=135487 RepID=UPI001C498D3E|nr:helix-turn-helix transcriptional regulator [Nocardia cyriacigeorgica]
MDTSATRRIRADIARLCAAGGESRTLRRAVLDRLARTLDFDYFAFVLTDPVTCVGCDPLAEVPAIDELPRLIRLKYATAVNRWTGLDDVGLLSIATAGHLEQSPMWREALAAHDVTDIASVVFRDRYGCWGFLDLWRCAPATPFTLAEADLLAEIVAPVTAALRRTQAATFAEEHAASTERNPLVLLLGPDLRMRAQTPQTHDYLSVLLPPPPARSPVPASAYNVAAQLLAQELRVDNHPARTRVHLTGREWVTLRADRIGAPPDADIAVTIERATPAERLDIFCRASTLSARESELITILSTGIATREAASALHLSEHTVQDHLKSIFAKTGTHSRRELLARAQG